MRVVIDSRQTRQLFLVTNLDEHTTVGALLQAAHVDQREWSKTWVDGVECSLDSPCVSVPVLEGSVIANTAPDQPDEGSWYFEVIGGPDTTKCYQLPREGTLRLGRADGAEISVSSTTVSWSHALISVYDDSVWITDDNSSNGTWVNGKRLESKSAPLRLNAGDIIQAGGMCLRLRVTANSDRTPVSNCAARTVVAFNRPPRPALPKGPTPVELAVKKDSQNPSKFSWITVLAPLVMAMAMVVMMGSVRYALIACLSPVMAIGSWFEQKRRAKASAKETEKEYIKDLHRLSTDIEAAAAIERERLQAWCPYPYELYSLATSGGSSIWQVRADHEDFWHLNLGVANQAWQVPVSDNTKPQERTSEVIDSAKLLAAPVDVQLGQGPIGVWGEQKHCVAIVRSMLAQLVTSTGPADTTIVVLTSKARSNRWTWLHWISHTMMGGANPNDRWIAINANVGQAMSRSLLDQVRAGMGPNLIVIVDELSLLQGKDAPARELLSYKPSPSHHNKGPFVSGIVIADNPHFLPASCYSVVEAKLDNEAVLTIPSQNLTIDHIITCGISEEGASQWAQALARFEDPEQSHSGGALPSLVHLFDLLGLDRETLTSDDVLRSWDANSGFSVPLGYVADGIFSYDLVKDGPHGLVGGTTGSGKSELLRSLVAGLASRVSPEELTFILVDFKGGAAFASLDQLPHTIGTLSNLEASLAYRAIRALEAEMAYRQQCFAKAGEGIDNLDAYLATNPAQPMPRLLVVVDEFAQLAKQYPDVLSSLVSIGAVGRTLGVHMILATQRPAGVVNDDILANTNMRTALRVQSREDSTNVISVPDASKIGREQKGRAYIKLGEDDISVIQTALVTGVSGQKTSNSLYVDPVELGTLPPEHHQRRASDEVSDMDLLIETIKQAAKDRGIAAPRPVWPRPLPDQLPLHLVDPEIDSPNHEQSVSVSAKSGVLVALADDPDHQRQYPTGWNLQAGNLLVVGIPGSGTTTALCSLALSLATTKSPDECDFLFLDLGNRKLEDLNRLSHGRGYAGPGSTNREIQTRLLRYVINEFEKRSSFGGQNKDLFIFIDGLASLREEYDDYDGIELLKSFYQVWVKGPAVGIYCVATSTSLKSIATTISEVTTQIWVFHLADSYDYSLIGVQKDNIPAPIPGRYVSSTTGHHAHIAVVSQLDETIRAINKQWEIESQPDLIRLLPERIRADQIAHAGSIGSERWLIPVGIRETNLHPAVIELYRGEHLLIAGPARSGKTSVLSGIAHTLSEISRKEGHTLTIVGIASSRSRLHECPVASVTTHDQASAILAGCLVASEPTVLLIDDAHLFTDPDGQVASLLTQADTNVVIIAAGRNDDLRSQYGQWTNTLRKSRLGILLQPDKDRDGELMGIMVPRKSPVQLSPGRGYVCHGGSMELIQAVSLDTKETNEY